MEDVTTTVSVELLFWSSPCIHNHSWTSISTCSLLWNHWTPWVSFSSRT